MHGDSARDAAHQLPGRFGPEAHAAAAPHRPAARLREGEKRGKKRRMRRQLRAQPAKNLPPVLTQVEVREQLVAELRLHETGKPGKPR